MGDDFISETLLLLFEMSPLLVIKVISRRGTVSGLMRDFTTGGTVGPDGRTGELAHSAAEVSCVTNLALENASCGPEDVRNTFLSLDLKPEKRKLLLKEKQNQY